MQIDQLFEFVYILIDKKQVTAREMARHFGVSSRTIYRWMEALSISGVPVYSLKGRGGGIAISENFTLDKTVLTEDERLAVVSSLKALDTLSGKNTNKTSLSSSPLSSGKLPLLNANTSAAQKLSRLVKTSDTDWLQVDFAPWSPEGSEVRDLFSLIRDSILKKVQITFDYFSGDGRSENRTVAPWKLLFRGQSWYLQGWCYKRQAQRFFKLTRMRNLIITSKKANQVHPDLTQADQIPDYSFPLIEIKAMVSKERLSYLMDAYICSSITPLENDFVELTFTAPDAPWLYEMLLGLGPQIKILGPNKIKDKIIEAANALVMLYK